MITVGLFGLNLHGDLARIGGLAEELGYDSLWVGDHVVLPRPRTPESPMEHTDPLLDPLVALGFLAAHTTTIRLATGIIVLPQRDPLVLAKQVASVDVLSGGRVTLGVGVGYLEPELTALGVPMAGRGARTEEHLAAMRSLWQDSEPVFRGVPVDAHPRPVQNPVPVVMGGHSAIARRRAARLADGWFGFMLGLRATAEQLGALKSETARRLEISVSPARRLDPEVVRAYADLGVDRLVVVPPPGLSAPELVDFVERNAPERLGAQVAGSSPMDSRPISRMPSISRYQTNAE